MISHQETFDKVVKALLLQVCKSQDKEHDVCMYRGADGNKCAVGHLIPDSHWSMELETVFCSDDPVRSVLLSLGYDCFDLLGQLQIVHDSYPVDTWRGEFRIVAKKFQLDDTVTYMYRNNQEIFEVVARHLLQQNARSLHENGTTCMYRSKNGLKCAVGALIPDHLYRKHFEWTTPLSSPLSGLLEKLHVDCHFARELQLIHDDYTPDEWPLVLKNFAQRNYLDSSFIKVS